MNMTVSLAILLLNGMNTTYKIILKIHIYYVKIYFVMGVIKMEIIYATTNDGKKNQVQEFLDYNGYDIRLITLKDIGFNEEIEETGETLEENSEIKAKATKDFCDKKNIKNIIVADDTGLEVDALGGRPGVYSARYAGDHAPQEKNIEKLLNEMKDVKEEDRTAKFTCVLTAILPNGEKVVSKGITKGKIATKPRNDGKANIWANIYTRWI